MRNATIPANTHSLTLNGVELDETQKKAVLDAVSEQLSNIFFEMDAGIASIYDIACFNTLRGLFPAWLGD